MSVFKKSCFVCGKKVDALLDNNMCQDCYTQQNPPIKEIKPVNMKICNQCGKIHFNNALQEVSDIEKMLPKIMKDRVILNEGYRLNNIEIKNFKVDKNKIKFDVGVNSDLI